MCHVQPEHINLLRIIGTVLLAAGVISIQAKKTYAKEIIKRSDRPFAYWLTVIFFLGFGASMWFGTYYCR